MGIESREQEALSSASTSGDVWSQIASQAYERNSPGIQLAASACNPKLDIPITPTERLLPPAEIMNTLIPPWRMGDGCRQIPRRPGAA